MEHKKKSKSIFTTVKYLFKFTLILLKEKLVQFKKLQGRFVEYRDSHMEIIEKETPLSKYSTIQIQPKAKNLTFPLLVLFDAENMPIQDYYNLVQKIITAKFGQTSWSSAKRETAYYNVPICQDHLTQHSYFYNLRYFW